MDLLLKSVATAGQQKPATSNGKSMLTASNENLANKPATAAADQKLMESDRKIVSPPRDILGLIRSNPSSSQKLVKSTDHRSMLTMSDDTMMMKQIQATHTPDGREVEVRPLFGLVEDILNRSTLPIDAVLAVYDLILK